MLIKIGQWEEKGIISTIDELDEAKAIDRLCDRIDVLEKGLMYYAVEQVTDHGDGTQSCTIDWGEAAKKALGGNWDENIVRFEGCVGLWGPTIPTSPDPYDPWYRRTWDWLWGNSKGTL